MTMMMQIRPHIAISHLMVVVGAVMLLLLQQGRWAEAQPSPGYYPSSKVSSMPFSQWYSNLWGAQHQSLSPDQTSLTLWMDRSSGSGFKSKRAYRNGYFGVSMKVQPGYTAGVNTAFYLSNNEAYPGYHDEIDVELLGTVPGEPYTLQTNVYVRGTGDAHPIVGREMRFHLCRRRVLAASGACQIKFVKANNRAIRSNRCTGSRRTCLLAPETKWLVKEMCLAVKQRVLQIGPLGGTQNRLLSGNYVALIMTGMERMMTYPREYLNELASSGFSSCTRVPD
ncbi:putative xyloglucan endotransglucosylase/hydrolase protein 32 [Triticum urartu]|uniref:Putative xyloglucan endotransglucosylase/hydrolase protein 32 n=1 Tax=Triticum urartu TaxID=4572 RepID=M7ZE56_TRIUA|nr:putative xyloglucan endotransglucosylase/hydrolase protein 32 [Triticum urartu]